MNAAIVRIIRALSSADAERALPGCVALADLRWAEEAVKAEESSLTPMQACALLVGDARLGRLCCRLESAVSVVNMVAGTTDYREIPDSHAFDGLLDMIRRGWIRRDAMWSRGADENLVRLCEIARGCMMIGDEYLDPVLAAFGPSRGLDANWSCMAWRVSGCNVEGVWLLDGENLENTVALVTRKDDGSGDPSIVPICAGTVAKVLPIALSIRGVGR